MTTTFDCLPKEQKQEILSKCLSAFRSAKFPIHEEAMRILWQRVEEEVEMLRNPEKGTTCTAVVPYNNIAA